MRKDIYKYAVNLSALGLMVLSSQIQAQRTTSYTYNEFGQVLTMDGPRTDVSDVMTYEYDEQGNRTRMLNALGHETLYTSYDPSGYLLSMTDPNGVVTDYTYDLRQRMTSYTVAAGTSLAATTTLEYDLVGNLTAVIQPNGAVMNYEYDAAHRLVAMEDGLGNRMEYTLDPAGNITQQDLRDPSGSLASTQTRVYDELSRLIETVGADSQTTGYSYDRNDNLVETEDGFLNPTSRSLDALNRVIEETDRDFNTSSFTYDTQDRLTSVTDQRGLTTTYKYNAYGDLIEQDSPDTGLTTFAYDNASNLIQRTDARGQISTYTYDALNRLLTVTYASDASENVTYSYDQGTNGIGRLTQIQDESGQTNYAYNALGQMTGKTVVLAGVTYQSGYSYDLAGNITKIVYPSGRSLDFGLDALGRIETVSTTAPGSGSQAVVQSVRYLPFGPVESYTYGNGVNHTVAYDQDYRVSSIVSAGALDRVYQYDFNNNITDIFDHENSGKDQDFTYDVLNRLTGADGAYGDISYEYDPVGNRTQRRIDDGSSVITESYSYSPTANQLDQITGSPGGTRNFNYDAAGNQTSGKNPEGESLSHNYNSANRPESATGPNGNSYYTHNALGQRVVIATNVPAETEHLHYDEQGNLLAVSDQNGNPIREYLYLGMYKVAMLVDDAHTGGNGGSNGGSGDGDNGDGNDNGDGDGTGNGQTGFADTDGDGLNDAWEIQFGLDPNDASDALADLDGDGYSNYVEYQLDSDPTDASAAVAYQHYVINPAQVGKSLSVISLADNNQITMGGTTLSLSLGELGVIPAGDVTSGAALTSAGPISAGSDNNATDMPISKLMAGTEFAVLHYRNNHIYALMSPEGDATVDITFNGVAETITLQEGVATTYTANPADNAASVIQSDVPILVMHGGASGSSVSLDAHPITPASKELWGDRRQARIGFTQNDTIVMAYASNGAMATYTGDAGDSVTIGIGNNGTEGSSDMIHLVANKPIAAAQYADADGSEATSYFPKTLFSKTYGLPVNAQYLQIACDTSTDVRVTEPGATQPITKACSSTGNTPGRVSFGSTSDGVHIQAGALIEADALIYLMYESSAQDEEHNLMGSPLGLVQDPVDPPEPTALHEFYVLNPMQTGQPLFVISHADNNEISMGNSELTLQTNEIGMILAADVVQGAQLTATQPVSVGATADNTDMPVSTKMAGTAFAIPHYRNDHYYFLMSPEGNATINITINGSTTTLNLTEGQVVSHYISGNNNRGGVLTSDAPILVTHAGASGTVINKDVYPVPPAATELWGDRRQGRIAILEDNTTVEVYTSGGNSQTLTGDAGDYLSISVGNNGTEGSSNMVHLVADKPIAGTQHADADGSETTGYWPASLFSRRYGLPVAAQYLQITCQYTTEVRFYTPGATTADIRTCTVAGNTPGRVNYGSTTDGANLPAGSRIESDEPIYLIYEEASKNDEHNLMGAQ